MRKLPAFQFYPGDWMKDPALRRCSPSARGVWIDMLCLMFECPERGVLSSVGGVWTDSEIAATISGETSVVLSAIVELLAKGVASRRGDGAIYSRRLIRDDKQRQQTKERVSKHRNAPVTRTVTPKYEDEEEKEVVVTLEAFDFDVWFLKLCEVYKKKELGPAAENEWLNAVEFVVNRHKLSRNKSAEYIIAKAKRYCELEVFQKGMTNWLRDKIFEQDESVWRRNENGSPKPNGKQSLEELYPDA